MVRPSGLTIQRLPYGTSIVSISKLPFGDLNPSMPSGAMLIKFHL
jgi:hypothetical protein